MSSKEIDVQRIHEVLAPWVQSRPEHLAIQDPKVSLTYGELNECVLACARQLVSVGVRPGDRVIIVGENCVAIGIFVFALSHIDAWSVVVNARLSPREVQLIQEHSGARLAVYTVDVSAEAAHHAELGGAAIQEWEGVGRIGIGPLNASAVPEPTYREPTEQVATLIYTSGTSGSPKGVMLTHANLIFSCRAVKEVRGLGSDEVVYGVLPMAHIIGLSALLIGTADCGSTLILEPRFSPERFARALREDGVTTIAGVPAMYSKLLEWSRTSGCAIHAPRLRRASVAGAPMTPELKSDVSAALGVPLLNSYGLTEMSPTVSLPRASEDRADTSVGRPLPGVDLRIVDTQGQDVGDGQVGELWVRGPNLMKGYYKSPEQTLAAINVEGWFNTGDLARRDRGGALFIVGRTKEMIIRSGFNVYPAEVEQAINTYPGVVQSAVVGRLAQDNEEVVAFVEGQAGVSIDTDDLLVYLRQRLSPYKLPSEVRLLDQLPAAATGKILKSVLREAAMSPLR
jgi:acyl-CoA synthetase (AMP-forming)/AMP-acid ligase II